MASRFRQASVLVAHEFRLVLKDRFSLMILVVSPFILMIFLGPVLRIVVEHESGSTTSASTISVPNLAVAFSYYAVSGVAVSFYRETGWQTWDRLRAATSDLTTIFVGKMVAPIGVVFCQQALLFGAGVGFLGLRFHSSPVLLLVTFLALGLCLVSLGVLVVSLTHTFQQAGVTQAALMALLSGLGGALTPVNLFPGWLRAIAQLTPTYWALRGYRATIVGASGTGVVFTSALILIAFSIVFASVGIMRLRSSPNRVWL